MRKILVLEDDIEFAEQLIVGLEEDGYDAVLFTTASEALTYLETNQVDLILADIFIRRNDRLIADGGIHLIAQLKQFQKVNIPIIAISGAFAGRQSDRIVGSAKAVGANATLAKPFAHEDLLKLLSNFLD